ncbi:MAG TPA: hypothetical protein VKR55_23275 [Bradyrhizobium sp.]|uniref:hypothetical protein n=1 Tax=Bradyrhizobium sp. TaxID=376 RepID=UPI002B801E27|nr:hypothetical protein [Bradyrhizobium sp.]HLZ05060.1 hypothetical protein [Bradyrhizobium sp.]
MKRFGCICLAALALSISTANSFGAEATLEWENGAGCRFKTRFDPAKYEKEKFKNTINVIFVDGFYEPFSPLIALGSGPHGRLTSNTAEFQRQCESTKDRIANLPVIELPGMEIYRKLSLEELEDWCKFNTVETRAASGDPAALREYTPSAAKCSRYIDALEGKTDIRTVWREAIDTQCRITGDLETCKANVVSGEKDQNTEEAIKRDVLVDGWQACSISYVKGAERREVFSARAAVEKIFRHRFKVRSYRCSDEVD